MAFEVVIAVNAPEERIWEALIDVEAWPKWTSSMTSVTRIDSGDFAVGSRAWVKQPKIGTMTWTVTELTTAHSFVWEATLSWADARRRALPQPGRRRDREPHAQAGAEGSDWSSARTLH